MPYFHVVFTLPHELAPLAWANKRVVYGLLFQAASQTLLEVAADKKHLGARIGLLAVLHTWGQTLEHHPHLHCVVPGGGLSPDGSRWIACREGFFLPVKVLSRVFRGKFLALLKQAHARDPLHFPPELRELADAQRLRQWLAPLSAKEWVVYAKAPFGGPEQVLKYLARYTHRVAISNNRLVSLENGQVTFRYQDYAHGNQRRTLTVSAVEFLRRFLLHRLPKGFVRIRHFGLLSNRHRKKWLEHCRQLLGAAAAPSPAETRAEPGPSELSATAAAEQAPLCPH